MSPGRSSFVGLVAMLWVGGGIIIHGLHAYGIDGPEQDHAIGVDQDWICKAELADTFRDLPDLLLRVSSRVPWIRLQLIWRTIPDA